MKYMQALLNGVVCWLVLAFPAAAAVKAVSVLDTDPGADTACGSDRTRNLSQPWVSATWTATKGYDIRMPMEDLITAVDANGRFTFCLDALTSALDAAEALGLPSSLTLFSGIPQPVVDYGVAHGEPTYVFVDPNPRHPGYGIPVTRLAPWAPSAMRAQQELYAAIRNLVVVAVPGTPPVCRIVNGKRVCTGGQAPTTVSRLTYFVHSPLPGMRYLRIIAGENDPTAVSGYSRATLEATVKAGYTAARGIAPLQVHEIYNVSDAEGDLSATAVGWAREAGDVGIFIENLQPNYPTCAQGQGKIMCDAGLPVVFEMVSPLGATDVVSAINWGEVLSPNVRDYRIYVDDANLFSGTTALKAASAKTRSAGAAPTMHRVPRVRSAAAH